MFSGRFVPSVYNQRIPRTISVSNAPFSHLLAQPWLIFGRKRVFFHDFGHFPTFTFSSFLTSKILKKSIFRLVFRFLAVFRPNGRTRPPQTLTFQYRTPRSRLVIPCPRDFSAENSILTQLFGEFQCSVFPVSVPPKKDYINNPPKKNGKWKVKNDDY